jgi:general secretion pathway protein N
MSRGFLLGIVFFVTLIGALGLRAPLDTALRFAPLERYQVSFERADGSLWAGRVYGLTYRGEPLGNVEVRARASSLFTGVLASDIRFANQGLAGRGRVGIGLLSGILHGEEIQIRGPVDRLSGLAPLLRQSTGQVEMVISQITLSPLRGCRQLQGVLETDVLTKLRELDWRGPPVRGNWSCEDGTSTLSFSGEADIDAIEGQLRLRPDRSYRLDVTMQTANEDVRQALPLLGFTAADDGWLYGREGRLIQ